MATTLILQTGSMWRLLFEIIYYLKYRKVEDITLRAYSELTDGMYPPLITCGTEVLLCDVE